MNRGYPSTQFQVWHIANLDTPEVWQNGKHLPRVFKSYFQDFAHALVTYNALNEYDLYLDGRSYDATQLVESNASGISCFHDGDWSDMNENEEPAQWDCDYGCLFRKGVEYDDHESIN